MNGTRLRALQQWMQALIEHPGDDDEAWSADETLLALSGAEGEEAVRSTGVLGARERIAIYRRMFRLRMTESMRIDYPGVAAALGEEEFDCRVLREYVRRFPSRSYTLDHLGRHFPEYLAASDLPQREFLADLARFELTVTAVAEAGESPRLTAERIAAVPAERWAEAKLVPAEAFRLSRHAYDVGAYLDAVEEERPLPGPVKRDVNIAVCRHGGHTGWRTLEEDEGALLHLLSAGMPVGAALERFAGERNVRPEETGDALFRWFERWTAGGYFSDIGSS